MILHKVSRKGCRITAYTITIGSAEARKAGFLNEDGSSKELEKLVDEKAGTITIRIARPAEEQSNNPKAGFLYRPFSLPPRLDRRSMRGYNGTIHSAKGDCFFQ